MSEIKVDTLTGKTTAGDITVTVGATATMSLEQGLAKAWLSLNGGGTIAIRDSLNISSVTDGGTGDYLHSFVNSFSAANYNQQNNGDAADGVNCGASITQTYSSSSSRSRYYNASFSSNDSGLVSVTNNGDLA